MLRIQFKKCCTDCASRDTVTDETKIYLGNSEVLRVNTIIRCSHEKVCKEYIETEEKES